MATLLSIEFLLGFFIFFIVYWLIAPFPKIQNTLLLSGGYYIVYLISPISLLVLLSWSLLILVVLVLVRYGLSVKKSMVLLVALMLIYFAIFKYSMPVMEGIRKFSETRNIALSLPALTILLPLGLSFYLFNSVSLIGSVAKKEITRPDVISALLYISFIPTLIAGPVNRAQELLPEIQNVKRKILDYKKACCLISLAMIKLFFLSAWLTDTIVNPVFNAPDEQNGWDTLIATYGWAWNIYFNFSGYTNLVTGLAMLLGYPLPKNFSHPYLAESLKAFWRDWHISLSCFIRDYIYIPLGGGRRNFFRVQLNIMIAMVLSGVWHGAGINFILWGAIHGAGLVIFNVWITRKCIFTGKSLFPVVARLLTFHYVCFAWIFFRADTFGNAVTLLNNILTCRLSSLSLTQFWQAGLFIFAFIIYPGIVYIRNCSADVILKLKWYALPFIIIPALVIAFYLAPAGVPGFIYANF